VEPEPKEDDVSKLKEIVTKLATTGVKTLLEKLWQRIRK